MKRVFNFNAGPSPMPIEVLEEMKNDLTDFRGTGMGITEISHRSPVFQDMLDETKAYLRQMMKLDDDYEIVFMQGGGTMQFLMTRRLLPEHRLQERSADMDSRPRIRPLQHEEIWHLPHCWPVHQC